MNGNHCNDTLVKCIERYYMMNVFECESIVSKGRLNTGTLYAKHKHSESEGIFKTKHHSIK